MLRKHTERNNIKLFWLLFLEVEEILTLLDFGSILKEVQNNIFNKILVNIHTYIIGHYNPSVRIIDLVSPTTYFVCVNFIHNWQDLQFNVDSERQIFLRNFSWQF